MGTPIRTIHLKPDEIVQVCVDKQPALTCMISSDREWLYIQEQAVTIGIDGSNHAKRAIEDPLFSCERQVSE